MHGGGPLQALFRQSHPFDFIQRVRIAIKPANDVNHIGIERFRLGAKILGPVAVSQRTRAAFGHGQASPAASERPDSKRSTNGRKKPAVQIRNP